MSDTWTPTKQELLDKSKEELVHIIEVMHEDSEFFRNKSNKLEADLKAAREEAAAGTAKVLSVLYNRWRYRAHLCRTEGLKDERAMHRAIAFNECAEDLEKVKLEAADLAAIEDRGALRELKSLRDAGVSRKEINRRIAKLENRK